MSAKATGTQDHRLGGLHANMCSSGLERLRSPRSRCWQTQLLVGIVFLACKEPLSGWVLTRRGQSSGLFTFFSGH